MRLPMNFSPQLMTNNPQPLPTRLKSDDRDGAASPPSPDQQEPKVLHKDYIRQDLQDGQDRLTTQGQTA
jgi:hypothetical protein